jgi:crotonobetainyl-CoA:carnitine CoA-transferase CaiB-like acyl-CoA transferase
LLDLADDPQVKSLEMFYALQHGRFGPVTALHRPIRYDGDKRSDFLPPPALGEHTDAVLREAGLSDSDIAGLRATGIV